MYQSKVWVKELWNILSGLKIQPEQSKNNNPACKKQLQVARDNKLYTVSSKNQYEPVVQHLRSVAMNQATWVLFSQGELS